MTDASDEQEPTPELELLLLRDGLPGVVETAEGLARAAAAIAAGTGPVALDAERASGYRYSARAYLIQLRREGSGTWLIDPIQFDNLSSIQEAIGDAEWILHAANQDLMCLREVGLRPTSLFDTEVAARLLGYPRVGLASLVEAICHRRMRKEHSASDWSKRPLPASWLDYAALDVEVLIEIREHLIADLEAAEKTEWAREEFEALLHFQPVQRVDPWRRTSHMHKARGRRAVAAVRELWQARNALAEQRDVTPSRLIPDSAIVAAANALPASRRDLKNTQGFHGRGAERFADTWVEAIQTARSLPENELPPVALRSDAPPPQRAWRDRDPVAAGRLLAARTAIAELSEARNTPVENLMTPDSVRRVLWTPPKVDDADLPAAVSSQLTELGARNWQIGLIGPILVEAIRHPAELEPKPDPAASEGGHADPEQATGP